MDDISQQLVVREHFSNLSRYVNQCFLNINFSQLKGIRSSPLNHIGEKLEAISETRVALEMMLTNRSELTYICPRLIINEKAANYGPNNLYLPPESDETNFLMEQLTIAVPKNFVLKQRINQL